jgi:hypothetical protein
MSDDDIVEKIRKKYERLSGVLDERSRRVWASAEAEALGYGDDMDSSHTLVL